VGWKLVCEDKKSDPRFPVEREPMWDGNEFQKNTRNPHFQLSENQCGMETEERKGYAVRPHALSENQCGMET